MYEEYLRIEEEYKALDKKREALRKEILADMMSRSETQRPLGTGLLVVARRAKWSYSEKLEDKLLKLEEDKVREQEQGIATKTETPFIQFKTKVNETKI